MPAQNNVLNNTIQWATQPLQAKYIGTTLSQRQWANVEPMYFGTCVLLQGTPFGDRRNYTYRKSTLFKYQSVQMISQKLHIGKLNQLYKNSLHYLYTHKSHFTSISSHYI